MAFYNFRSIFNVYDGETVNVGTYTNLSYASVCYRGI